VCFSAVVSVHVITINRLCYHCDTPVDDSRLFLLHTKLPCQLIATLLLCCALQVKDYRHHASPTQGQDDKSRGSLGCARKGETAEQRAKPDMVRQTSDEQTQFDIPSSRVLTDETNLPQLCLQCEQHPLVPAHSLRSHFPCKVCIGCCG